jgi:hypothetical protein
MRGLVLAAVIGSVRRLLAITIAVLAVAAAFYFGTHKLSNPDQYQYGGCPSYSSVVHSRPPACLPPTLAGWQIPLAAVIAVLGLGAAAAVSGPRS